MIDTKTTDTVAAAPVADVDTSDRRRPGRPKEVSPVLVPLLRGETLPADIEFEQEDQAAALRGIAFGVILSAPLWYAIARIGSWLASN